ncbi:unnamed protein product [Closterium sp. NIES-65]|nr:unnamed protein product [Closterium sp. NIES-65]
MAGRCYLLSVSNLVGAWFEVGSSALHKFSTASGLSCNAAKYSALATATDGSNVAGFLSRGLRTVSPLRADQVWRISAAAGRISRNLRRVCEAAVYSARAHASLQAMLVPGPQGVGGGVNSSGTTPTSDSSSNSTSPFSQQANGTALAAVGILAASGATLSQQALAIYNQLGALQQHNNRASTFNDPQDPGLDVTKQGLADAANRIIAAAGRAQRAGMRGSLAVLQMQLMLPAANSSAATRFTSRLSGFLGRASWELGVRGKVGLATTVIRLLAASVLVPSLTMFPSPFPWNSQTQLRMQAVQDRKQPGKFAVSLFGFARNNNYLINKLEGNADSEYNMATIVSCDGGQTCQQQYPVPPSHASSSPLLTSTMEITYRVGRGSRLAAVLACVAVWCAAWQRARAGDTYFCQELVKETVGACPDVQTSNTFMAEFFQGKWYEIGSTAESKLEVSGELGMSCVTYNFVFRGINHSLNRFSVVKRGIRMTTPARQSQIQGLSNSATLQVSNAQQTLSWAELPNDVEADVKVALGDIANSMAQVSARAERAYNLLARIQQLNAQLSQMDRVFFIWQTKQKLVSAVKQLQRESTAINKGRVSIMKSAQIATRRVNKVENKLGNLRGKQTVSPRGGEAARRCAPEAAVVLHYTIIYILPPSFHRPSPQLLLNLNDIVGLTRNVSGFGRATGRMGAATASMRPMAGLMFSNPLAMRFSYSAIGAVTQVEASQVGKMQVTYGNGRGVVENMWVAGLWGNQALSDSYSMALIYSCFVPPANIGSGRTSAISFRLLSRSPSVSQADVDSALQLLEQQGVPMGGPNPYVPTFQLGLPIKRAICAHHVANPHLRHVDLSRWCFTRFGIRPDRITIGRVLKGADRWVRPDGAADVIRVRGGAHSELECAMARWIANAGPAGVPLTLATICDHVATMARNSGIPPTFRCSIGWARRALRRQGVRCMSAVGKAADQDTTSIRTTKEKLPQLLMHLSVTPSDTFNFDETALFLSILPRKTVSSQWRRRGTVRTGSAPLPACGVPTAQLPRLRRWWWRTGCLPHVWAMSLPHVGVGNGNNGGAGGGGANVADIGLDAEVDGVGLLIDHLRLGPSAMAAADFVNVDANQPTCAETGEDPLAREPASTATPAMWEAHAKMQAVYDDSNPASREAHRTARAACEMLIDWVAQSARRQELIDAGAPAVMSGYLAAAEWMWL